MKESTKKIIEASDKAMEMFLSVASFEDLIPGSDEDPEKIGKMLVCIGATKEAYEASKDYLKELDNDFETLHEENKELKGYCKKLEYQNEKILEALTELKKSEVKES